METVLASLGLGTRYCLVSDDHERPEPYADDEHERGPQSLLERCTDLGAVHEVFSRAPAAGGKSGGGGGGGGLLGRLRQQRDQRDQLASRPLDEQDVKKPTRRERMTARSAVPAPEKENAGPRGEGGSLGLFERLTTRHSEGRLAALGGLRPASRGDQGSAPLMTGDNGSDSWGWNASPGKTSPSADAQWGSGAAWDDAQLVAPKTKAAKEAKSRSSKKAGGSDQASLIDLGGENKEDDWQSWEDDAWASLERK